MVTIKTYRHIVLEFRSTSATPEQVNEIANAKVEEILSYTGPQGVTGQEKGKEVYWTAYKG